MASNQLGPLSVFPLVYVLLGVSVKLDLHLPVNPHRQNLLNVAFLSGFLRKHKETTADPQMS